MSRREKRANADLATPLEARASWLTLGAIALVAVLASIAGLANGFAHDDFAIIPVDPRLHDAALWPEIFAKPYWPPPYVADLYRPIASLLLAIQYSLGAGSPIIFRIVSYGLYAALSIAVLQLARRLLSREIAFGIALLFAAHPVHVEAVALAVAQNELLVALLISLSVGGYVSRRRVGAGTLTGAHWILIAAAYVIAALSKEQGFLLPGFLVITELCLVERETWRERLSEVGWGFVALGAVGVTVLLVRIGVLGDQAVAAAPAEALVNKTFLGRLVTMWRIVPDWMRLLVWPAHLRMDYSPQEFVGAKRIGLREITGLLLLLSLIAAAFMARKRAAVVTFGIAWLGLALFPVSNVLVPTGILIGERTLLLPSVGLLIAAGGAMALLLESRPQSRRVRMTLAVATGLLIGAGMVRSAMRHPVWHDNTSLTLAAVAESPRSWRAHANYAELLYDRGEANEGRAEFERAIALAPSPWWVRNSLARRLRMVNDDAGALDQLQKSVMEFPEQPEAVSELAAALIAVGRYEEARGVAQRIIVTQDAPPIMVSLKLLADSALAAKAPAGSVRVTIPSRHQR